VNLGMFALMALAGALGAVLGMRIARVLRRRRRRRSAKPPSKEPG